MSHQRAPGFGRPSQIPIDSNNNSNSSNNLNIVSSGFWSKSATSTPNTIYNINPFTYPIGNQFNESSITGINTVNGGGGGVDRVERSTTLLRDDHFWKQSPCNNLINAVPTNSRSSMAINVSTSSNKPTSTYTNNLPLNNNLTINGNRVKPPSQSSRIHGNYLPSTHDLLLAQFLGLCLDNQQQSISNDNLNSLSSSSSYGSHNLIDPIGAPLNQTNTISSLRKLKARITDDNLSSSSNPNHNISLDQYHHPAIPIISPSSHNSGGGAGGNGRRKNRRGSCIECVFCKNNGQPSSFYQSHVLKDVLGRVTCPILFAYDCPICHNGGGPKAHTVRYCPQNKPSNRLRNALLKAQIG